METAMETWLPIKGYEGRYEISSLGNVRSCPRMILRSCFKGQILKPFLDGENGYLMVGLYNSEGVRKTVKVHRLVAQTFIPNPANLPQVNHKEGDKTDNRASMLEWCTNEFNMNHAMTTGLVKKGTERHCYGKKLSTELKDKLRLKNRLRKKLVDNNTGKIYESIKQAAVAVGIPETTLKRHMREGKTTRFILAA